MKSKRAALLAAVAGLALCAANTNAQSTWAGAVSDSWFNAARWAPAGVPNSAATNVSLGLAGTYTVSMQNGSATCGTLTIGNPSATLNLFDNAFLNVSGNITNSGLIQISGPGTPGNLTRLQVASSALTASGSGTLRLAAIGNGDTPTATKVVMCYANCDGSLSAPTLNVNDFSCFLNSYAAGDAFANCDGSTSTPVLNVNDFSCFLNKYAAGCP